MPDLLQPVPPDEDENARPQRRLLWFAALSLLGVAATAGLAYFLRLVLWSAGG